MPGPRRGSASSRVSCRSPEIPAADMQFDITVATLASVAPDAMAARAPAGRIHEDLLHHHHPPEGDDAQDQHKKSRRHERKLDRGGPAAGRALSGTGRRGHGTPWIRNCFHFLRRLTRDANGRFACRPADFGRSRGGLLAGEGDLGQSLRISCNYSLLFLRVANCGLDFIRDIVCAAEMGRWNPALRRFVRRVSGQSRDSNGPFLPACRIE